MVIYLDVIWILNILVDFLLLLLTHMALKERTPLKRVLFGALIASFIVPIQIYFPNSVFMTIWAKALYSLLIVLCAFRYRHFVQVLKRLLMFYFISFCVGGGLFAIHFMLDNPIDMTSSGILSWHHGYGTPISWLFVCVTLPVVFVFTKKRLHDITHEKILFDQLCRVHIYIKNMAQTTIAFVDSGNQLLDPLTKKPVIVCDEDFMEKWFTDSEWEKLSQAHKTMDYALIPEKWRRHIHIVPFKGIEGTRKFMIVVKPKKLSIVYEGQTMSIQNVLIGIHFSRLTEGGEYQCLLHPHVLQ